MADPFIAEIVMFGGNFSPRGWSLCNGQLLPISSYSALFSLLGTTYGGDGETTFGLPDIRGRSPIHAGDGPGLTPRPLGARGGSEYRTLTVNNLPSHNHNLLGVNELGDQRTPGGNAISGDQTGDKIFKSGSTPSAVLNTATVQHAGGQQQFSIMPPFIAINYIIALQGIYPSEN